MVELFAVVFALVGLLFVLYVIKTERHIKSLRQRLHAFAEWNGILRKGMLKQADRAAAAEAKKPGEWTQEAFDKSGYKDKLAREFINTLTKRIAELETDKQILTDALTDEAGVGPVSSGNVVVMLLRIKNDNLTDLEGDKE